MLRNVFSIKLIIKKCFATFFNNATKKNVAKHFFIELIIKMLKQHLLIKKMWKRRFGAFFYKAIGKMLKQYFS
jgi:hypothetical protein